ncbi:carbon-nitrogen hydrolase family protein [Pseudoduganella violaceinigra]|uniref:carbon-nitrogen hydrolase family protein n=1 Tax=Pseudoduganella violaceinigra TaxID=246602 RepID=UPI0003F5C2BF|nr:carbon-nitrogen hydrolase family protein [Pseudoduganella violaceinigra]
MSKVAAIQMVSTPVVEQNIATARRLVGAAAAKGAQLVLLPEYWAIMGMSDSDKVGKAEPLGQGPIQDCMSAMAREHGIWLLGGTLPLASNDPERVINTTLVYDPQGQHVGRYDKIHLFGFSKGSESYDEARTIVPGKSVGTVETAVGKVGMSVCYDLRFPELYRAMGPLDLIVVPAAFTYTTGKAHWEILLRARAIENQCYVLAAAQGGSHVNGRRTWGHSMLVDPWGEIKAVLAEGEGVVAGELDPAFVHGVRESLPALKHRIL